MLDKKCIVFDLDGTVYFGDNLAENAKKILQYCYEKFEHVFFVTNNSAKTRNEIYQKLYQMGLNIDINHLITCGYTIAKYLTKNNYENVFTIGTESLKKELKLQGINPESKDPQAIVVGYNREFCLEDLKPIVKYKNTDLNLIIANKEHSYPWNNGELLPGAGQIIVSVDTAKKQAKTTLEEEILTLICHGILHLLGFDHLTKKDYDFVVRIQNKVIKELWINFNQEVLTKA